MVVREDHYMFLRLFIIHIHSKQMNAVFFTDFYNQQV